MTMSHYFHVSTLPGTLPHWPCTLMEYTVQSEHRVDLSVEISGQEENPVLLLSVCFYTVASIMEQQDKKHIVDSSEAHQV